MPHTVRTHTRRTASGRTVTVRQHTRKGGSTRKAMPRSRRQRAVVLLGVTSAVLAAAVIIGSIGAIITGVAAVAGALVYLATPPARPARGAKADESWWAEEPPPPARPAPAPEHEPRLGDREFPALQAEMRAWRARPEPVPSPAEPMNPQLARVLGCDTPEGLAVYERGRAYREAGYSGPLDDGNHIPDPDDPANHTMLHALAALRETNG